MTRAGDMLLSVAGQQIRCLYFGAISAGVEAVEVLLRDCPLFDCRRRCKWPEVRRDNYLIGQLVGEVPDHVMGVAILTAYF